MIQNILFECEWYFREKFNEKTENLLSKNGKQRVNFIVMSKQFFHKEIHFVTWLSADIKELKYSFIIAIK